MRSCEQYIADMNLSIDGLLEPEQERALQAHLAQCAKCRSLYQSYQDIQAAILESEVEPPKGLTHSVMERIHGEKTRHSPKATLKRMRFTLVAAVIALVVVATGKYISIPSVEMSTKSSVPTAEAAVDAGDGAAFAPRVAAYSPEDLPNEAAVQADEPMLGAAPDASQMETAEDSTGILETIQAQLDAQGQQGSVYLLSDDAVEIQRLLPHVEAIRLSSGITVYKVRTDDYEAVRTELTELGGIEDRQTDFVYLYSENS